MKSWKEITLGDDYIVTNAKTLNKDYQFSEIFYLDTGSITKGKVDSYQKISLKDAPSRAKRLLSNNDIIYSSVRPANRHYGFFSNPIHNLVISTGFIVITCNEKKLFPLFLYYYLAQDQIVEELHSIAEGSTSAYPSLLPTDIESMVISIPPTIHEQRAIAAVLSSLDDKIDLLHRQNATLEAMAEALFRQWFVVEAKEDWEDGMLGDILQLMYGKNLREEDRSGTGYPVVGSNGVVGYHDNFLVDAPGIVIGRKGTLGKVILLDKPFYPIDTTYYVNSIYDFDALFFLYFLLKSINFEELNTDSAVPGLNRNIAHAIEIKKAPVNIIKKFEYHVLPLFKKINQNQTQIRTLEKLRDTLLPKLMSGEVRVAY